MKKFIFGLIVGLLLSSSMVIATQPIKLIINGNLIQSDVPPQIINGRTMVPARPLAEALGAKVEWDGENNTVAVDSLLVNNTNKEDNEKGDIIINDVIKDTTFNGLGAIEVDGERYFSAKDYSDKFYDTKTFGYDSAKNMVLLNEKDSITEILNIKENVQIYKGRTYIHNKFYR